MHKAIRVSAEPKIIGVNNGIYQIELDKKMLNKDPEISQFYDFFDSYSFWDEQEKGFDIIIPSIKAKMLKKAKLTDIMGYTPNVMAFRWVISEKILSVIKQFNIGTYNIFELDIESVKEKYYLFFKEFIKQNELIYPNSILFTGHEISKDFKEYNFNNYQEYRIEKDKNVLMQFRKIAIDKKYENEDIIFTQASTHAFFSERLIDILIEAGITGLETSSSVSLEFV